MAGYITTGPNNEKIVRDRILNILFGNMKKNFIFLHSAAGYGKTTILNQLSAHSENPVYCMTLDSDIAHFEEFFCLFCEFLTASFHPMSKGPQYGAIADKDPDLAVHASIIQSVLKGTTPAIVCIDNIHRIQNEKILALLDSVVQLSEPQHSFVFTSRQSLPDILSKQVLYGDGICLGTEILRFTDEESIQFFKDNIAPNDFSEPQIKQLVQRCEGWPAALNYFLLKLNQHAYGDGSLRPDEDNLLFYYIKYEVFDPLNQEIKDFLLGTGFLESFSSKLCSYVTGTQNAEGILFYLEKNRLFIQKVPDTLYVQDNQQTHSVVYRYCSLFSEFLVSMATYYGADYSGRASDVYWYDPQREVQIIIGLQKAALFYYENNSFYRSTAYSVKAGLKDLALRSAVNACLEFWDKSDFEGIESLNNLLQGLGTGIETDTNYRFLQAILMHNQGKHIEALKLLSDILEPLRSQSNKQLYIIAVQLLAISNRNIVSVQSSIDFINREEIFFKNFKMEFIFDIVAEQIKNHLFVDDIPTAELFLDKMYHKAVFDGDMVSALSLKSFFVTIYFTKGELKKGMAVYKSLANVDADIEKQFEKTMARVSMAKFYQSMGNPDEAVRLIELDIRMKQKHGMPDDLFITYATAADIYAASCPEHFGEAMEYLKILVSFSMKNRQNKFFYSYTTLYRVILSVLYREYAPQKLINPSPTDFEEFLDISPDEALENMYPFVESMAAAYISCLYIEQGDYAQALEVCRKSAETAEASGLLNIKHMSEGIELCIDLILLEELKKTAVSPDELVNRITDFLEYCNSQNTLNMFKRLPILKRLIRFGYEKDIQKDFCIRALTYVGDRIAHFYVKTLGEFNLYDIQSNSLPIKFDTYKSKELFAFFIANYNRSVNRNYILEKLWPDTTKSKAISHLHLSIHQLRKTLSGAGLSDIITYRRGHYVLYLDLIDVDIIKFNKPMNENLNEELLVEELENRCGLYQGLFMLDFGWEGLETTATHFEILYTSYLTKLAAIYEKTGDQTALNQIANKLNEISNQYI